MLVIAALSLLGSVFLSATANGIAIFMLFGAGLAAGLLGQIGDALSVEHARERGLRLLLAPALRGALPGRARRAHRGRGWLTGVIVQLGPFGGAQEGGPLLWLWAIAYLVLVGRRRGPASPAATSEIHAARAPILGIVST